MGKNITAILAAAACAVLCGCMSDNEMYLRKKDIEAKASHPASFQPLVLSGPIELKQGATLTVSAPTQPYVPTSIPNGQQIWTDATTGMVQTGALAGVALYGIGQAGDGKTTKTYNYSNGGTAE